MTEATESDEIEPQPDQLWILLYRSKRDTRLAIGRVIEKRPDEDVSQIAPRHPEDDIYRAEILYDAYDVLETPFTMGVVPESTFYAQLPEEDEWDDRFEQLLDYHLGYITRKEVAELLAGEDYHSHGREGYEALRIAALEGISDSLTEFSVHQGHGPSRYGQSVRNRMEEMPEWLAKDALESEKERWTGGFIEADQAAYIVEVLLAMEDLLDEDHEDEIRSLVQEYDLEYDEYREVEC